MEFLKPVFGDRALTYAELEAALKDSKDVKLANLAGGGYVDKGKYDAKVAELTTAQGQIKALNETVKKFDGVDVEGLKTKIIDLEKTHAAELQKVRKDSAIDVALLGAKARNVKAARALIDDAKITLKEDGTLEGLDIAAMQKDAPYLFEITETKDKGTGQKGGQPGGSDPDKKGTLADEIRGAIFGAAK